MLNLSGEAARSQSRGAGWRELGVLCAGALALAVAVTWPLAAHLGSVGRVDQADGQFSIWNVAWVAHALGTDPLHVFDANIFFPHRWTLAYSENNLGAGLLATPAYWLTSGNPYAAHNSVVLLAFALSQIGMYLLVRHLTANRGAAAVSAICYAFCPYVFAWTAEIQLLMIFPLPFVMLALHRAVERPTAGRGAALGAAMAGQTLFCGYYGVFAALMVGYGVIVLATARRSWTNRRFWIALAAGAVVALVAVIPIFAPYLALQRVTGFSRPLADAFRYSANWSAFLASGAYAHRWMLPLLPRFNGVLFPGFVAIVFAIVGAVIAPRGRQELVWLYGGLATLAAWAAFGPSAGLYAVLYRVLPIFAWLRAPSRFGLIVAFGLSTLAGIGVAALTDRARRPWIPVAIALVAALEILTPFRWPAAPAVAPVYTVLRTMPRGAVIEMPFYYPQVGLFQHTKYMLASTSHWFPLVNGYSDYTPPDFMDNVMVLAAFPSRYAFNVLKPLGVRYVVFHMYGYNTPNRNDVLTRLREFDRFLRPVYVTDDTRLYEITGFPD